MTFAWAALALPVLLGLLTGAVLGLSGAGGGIIAAPLLILLMQLPVAAAAPIALLAVVLGAGLGMLIGLRQGNLRYRAALLMAATGLLASPLGIQLSRLLPNPPLVIAFSLLLLYQARRQWQHDDSAAVRLQPCALDQNSGRFIWNRPCALALMRAGLLAGFLSGLLGVGGGFVLVPALRKQTPLPMHSIAATSLMVLTLVSLGSLAQWQAHGQLDWALALPFVAGTLLGMGGGRLYAPRIAEPLLRRLFAALCLVIALGLAAKALIPGGV